MSEQSDKRSKNLFILDTNVLMHDPTALGRFQENDVFLPMVVLEEMDEHKKGVSEVSRSVRHVSRVLDELMKGQDDVEKIKEGVSLNINNLKNEEQFGRLFFQTRNYNGHESRVTLPTSLPANKPDNILLGVALGLMEENNYRKIVLVSKDINVRLKAALLGIKAEDYENDIVLDDINLLYSGDSELNPTFWEVQGGGLKSYQQDGRNYYEVSGPEVASWSPNQCLYLPEEEGFEAIVSELDGEKALLKTAVDYRGSKHTVWGISARNREQNFALNLLMDPDIDFVSLVGTAGTGKTLLALAAALTQTLEANLYKEILMTRVTVPVGEDIGFLPGTEEEKMTPWMGALMDNLEVLTHSDVGDDWGRAATNDLLSNRIKIRSLNFMRGRTFLNKYIIIDEAQNLSPKQMKTLVTRAGPGTKVICLGNVAQIDTPYVTETSSGLTYVVDRFKSWKHSGHIMLTRGERSRLADFASEVL